MQERIDQMIKSTEKMLYEYPVQKNLLSECEAEKETILKYGMLPSSWKVTDTYTKHSNVGGVSEYERQEARIFTLDQKIEQAQKNIDRVDQMLEMVKGDPFYELIRMKYFEHKTNREIGIYFRISADSVTDAKNNLIRDLTQKIYGDEYLNCVLSWLMM